jgi:DNA phosphorothioation-associated putative methyltransferase
VNVIEDPKEREAVVREAFELTERVLCVAALYDSPANRPTGEAVGDGVVTRRNTFQKLFDQSELLRLIESATSEQASAIAPGIAFVFKDAEARLWHEITRTRRRYVPIILGPSNDGVRSPLFEQLIGEHAHEWDEYRRFVLDNGRPPESHESQLVEQAKRRRISPDDMFGLAIEDIGAETFELARGRVRDDLLVFLATSHFGRKPKLSELPKRYQIDIRHHFGSLKRGLDAGMAILTESANPDVRRSCALESFAGKQADDGLFVLPGDAHELDVRLRAYIGLGTLFFGDSTEAELVKIHLSSNKVTFYLKDDEESFIGFKVDFRKRKMATYAISASELRRLL